MQPEGMSPLTLRVLSESGIDTRGLYPTPVLGDDCHHLNAR